MSTGRSGDPRACDASALAAEAEGYLMARAHLDDAHREARALCAALPWLTTAQAEDLSRHYVEQRIALARRLLQDTIRRAGELRQEYEARYRTLRRTLLRRHAACASVLMACAAGIGTAFSALGR
ncbi:hypothetical protein SUDANB6_05539 [Streptomyces sp. enrichment culture]|uniref:hypothetical protein n=1 Tax=Streptomyces sp. enrichment culture TaxID=1795815 RepID=UPI003F568E19